MLHLPAESADYRRAVFSLGAKTVCSSHIADGGTHGNIEKQLGLAQPILLKIAVDVYAHSATTELDSALRHIRDSGNPGNTNGVAMSRNITPDLHVLRQAASKASYARISHDGGVESSYTYVLLLYVLMHIYIIHFCDSVT